MQSEHIVLDTNIWLSFLITKNYIQLDRILQTGRYKLAFSQDLIEEFIEVASRPKFKKYFKKRDVLLLLQSIHEFADFFDVTTEVNVCRDPNDNFLLSLAFDSRAKFLITGDKGILELKKINQTEIITFADFLRK